MIDWIDRMATILWQIQEYYSTCSTFTVLYSTVLYSSVKYRSWQYCNVSRMWGLHVLYCIALYLVWVWYGMVWCGGQQSTGTEVFPAWWAEYIVRTSTSRYCTSTFCTVYRTVPYRTYYGNLQYFSNSCIFLDWCVVLSFLFFSQQPGWLAGRPTTAIQYDLFDFCLLFVWFFGTVGWLAVCLAWMEREQAIVRYGTIPVLYGTYEIIWYQSRQDPRDEIILRRSTYYRTYE